MDFHCHLRISYLGNRLGTYAEVLQTWPRYGIHRIVCAERVARHTQTDVDALLKHEVSNAQALQGRKRYTGTGGQLRGQSEVAALHAALA